jgi:hypothetical protein
VVVHQVFLPLSPLPFIFWFAKVHFIRLHSKFKQVMDLLPPPSRILLVI